MSDLSPAVSGETQIIFFRAPLFIVVSGLSERRTEHRNRSVQVVHEDLEHRATKQSNRGTNK